MRTRVLLAIAALLFGISSAAAQNLSLLNVSYDPTRELYAEFNKAFVSAYQKETGKKIEHQAVARRLGLAGAWRDRRPAG